MGEAKSSKRYLDEVGQENTDLPCPLPPQYPPILRVRICWAGKGVVNRTVGQPGPHVDKTVSQPQPCLVSNEGLETDATVS